MERDRSQSQSDAPRLVEHLRSRQIAVMELLQRAGLESLVLVDAKDDAISPNNRLLLHYTGLHEFVSDLSNDWAENDCDVRAHFSSLLRTRAHEPPGEADGERDKGRGRGENTGEERDDESSRD